MAGKMINPHPGEILLEEFLKPLGISQNRLAMEIRVPCHRINEPAPPAEVLYLQAYCLSYSDWPWR